jgi:23S rRNA (cytidine2498-2'-O)-methyltransferase
VQLVLSADDSKAELVSELSGAFAGHRQVLPGLFEGEPRGADLPRLVFARQILPDARELAAPSIRAWAEHVVAAVAGVLPDDEPWSLHVFAFREVADTTRVGAREWHSRARAADARPRARSAKSGATQTPAERPRSAEVGQHRCDLIIAAVKEQLQKKRRHLLRQLRPEPGRFEPNESVVQLLLTSPEHGFLSVAPSPLAFQSRYVLSCFPGGRVALANDKRPPSRAFAKLVEAEARMGRRIVARERCVDLGASPGSWTYVAARRGARVVAVDRAELRDDLMRDPMVTFERGDAFRFEPAEPVDWLICDVIAAAERSAGLLLRWLERGWCRHFVVTLKLDSETSQAALARLLPELERLSEEHWVLRLSANKREVCAFGTSAG